MPTLTHKQKTPMGIVATGVGAVMQGASSEPELAISFGGKCLVDALGLPWRLRDNAFGRADPMFAALYFRRGFRDAEQNIIKERQT